MHGFKPLCAAFATALIGLMIATGSSAQAKETPAPGVSVDPEIAAAMATLTPHQRADRLQVMRAFRRYIHRRLPLASDTPFWITDEPVRQTRTLDAGMALFRSADKGVWCQAAAVMLARLYTQAGYRAWVTSYGDEGSLTHVVTLVEVGGRLYMEDAYFNYDFVDRAGRPLPYPQVLKALRAGHLPKVRQDLDFRLGIFANRDAAENWTVPGLRKEILCIDQDHRQLCNVASTERQFEDSYYIRDKVMAFLKAEALPTRFAFLMLFPLWTTGPNYPAADDRAAEIESMVEALAHRAG